MLYGANVVMSQHVAGLLADMGRCKLTEREFDDAMEPGSQFAGIFLP